MDEQEARQISQRIFLLMKSDSDESFAKFLLMMRRELHTAGVNIPTDTERIIRTAYTVGYTDSLINLLDRRFLDAEQMLKEVR